MKKIADAADFARFAGLVARGVFRDWLLALASTSANSRSFSRGGATLFDDDRPEEPEAISTDFMPESFAAACRSALAEIRAVGFDANGDLLWLYSHALRASKAWGVALAQIRPAGEDFRVAGYLAKIKTKMTKSGKFFAKFTLFGSEATLPCIAWSEAAKGIDKKLVEGNVVVACGYTKDEMRAEYNSEDGDAPAETERTLFVRSLEVVDAGAAYREAAKYFVIPQATEPAHESPRPGDPGPV